LRVVQQASTDQTRRGWELRDADAPDKPSPINDGFSESSFGTDEALVADDATLAALRAPGSAPDALREDGAVVLAPGLTGAVVLTTPSGSTATVKVLPSRYTIASTPTILVTEGFARDHDLVITDGGTLFRSAATLTASELDALEDIAYDAMDALPLDAAQLVLDHAYPRTGLTEAQLELLLGGLALVFALFVVGVSLALAAAESKDERDILTIAGAPPGVVARSAGARAWLMASIGAVMAVPVGFLPIVVVHLTSNQSRFNATQFPLVFPSRTVALLVLVVPAIVAVVAFGTSAASQRLRPVRISTATFE
jgi:hypothetical protein